MLLKSTQGNIGGWDQVKAKELLRSSVILNDSMMDWKDLWKKKTFKRLFLFWSELLQGWYSYLRRKGNFEWKSRSSVLGVLCEMPIKLLPRSRRDFECIKWGGKIVKFILKRNGMSNIWMRNSKYFTLTVSNIYQCLAIGCMDNIDTIILHNRELGKDFAHRVTRWNGALRG